MNTAKGRAEGRESSLPRGIYLSIAESLLGWRWLAPAWALWKWFWGSRLGATITVGGRSKLHPAVPEGYQLLMVACLALGVACLPAAESAPTLYKAIVGLAWYRAWEILVYSLKWLLVGPIEPEPLFDHRRSLICFVVNIVEVSAAFTIVALPVERAQQGEQWAQVAANIAAAFRLEVPSGLLQPYASILAIEATVLVLFVLACVVGGIQRKTGSE